MNAKPVPWSDLQFLIAVQEAGSMLAAATRLGTAASTVGRRLDALEARVGTPLVERSPQGILLTPAGVALARCGGEMQLALARTLRELPRPGQGLVGTIRVSAGDGFADAILEAAASMAEAHPALRFELALEDRAVDLPRREADVAVRTVHRREGSLVYRRVTGLPYGLFAASGYLEARGRPVIAADLAAHRWLGFAPPLDRLPVNRWLSAQVGAPPTLQASTFHGLTRAAHAGLGVAALPIVAADGLARVLDDVALPSLPVWLVVHRDARKQPHIAAFCARLFEALAARAEGGASAR